MASPDEAQTQFYRLDGGDDEEDMEAQAAEEELRYLRSQGFGQRTRSCVLTFIFSMVATACIFTMVALRVEEQIAHVQFSGPATAAVVGGTSFVALIIGLVIMRKMASNGDFDAPDESHETSNLLSNELVRFVRSENLVQPQARQAVPDAFSGEGFRLG